MKKLEMHLKPMISIILALVIGAGVITMVGEDALNVYSVMLQGAFGTTRAAASTLVKATTLIFVGLSYGFAYKCGLINIGIEGQLYAGALAGTIAAVYLKLPAVLHIPVCLFLGFVGGGLWGGLAGFLKNRFGANEMITTVMLNYIAVYLVGFMVNGPIKEAAGTYPQTEIIQPTAELPVILPKTQLSIGLFLAAAALLLYFIFWHYTSEGYEMSMVGSSNEVARYGGIPVRRTVFLSMVVAGGFGGLAGCMEVMGVQHKLLAGLSAGYGFDGIAVSLLGGNGAVGIFLSSILFGALRSGGNSVQMFTKVPMAVIYILQGLVILFAVLDLLKGKKEVH